jgi:nucleotide-binding universal stress UspA family protein
MSGHTTHPGIVACVDGSPASMTAVRWAACEAVMRNVVLTLTHVIYAQRWGPVLFGQQPAVATELSQQQQAVGQQCIANAIKVVEDDLENRTLPHLDSEVLSGPPVPALVEVSKEAQMMVVGCRVQSLLDRVLLGSVSTGLVHHAHCPVAVIPDDALAPVELSQLPVVVGIDGSPASELATEIAFEEASFRGVDLVALHAWSDADMFDIGTVEWSAQQASEVEALAERLAGWQERYPDVNVCRRIVLGHPARHLIDEGPWSQLVVVGSRGRGGFPGMLLGSVSTAVVQAGRAPVVVARSRCAGGSPAGRSEDQRPSG